LAAISLYLLILAGVIIIGSLVAALSTAVPFFCSRLHHRERRVAAAVSLGMGVGTGCCFSAGGLQRVDLFKPASGRGNRAGPAELVFFFT